MIDNETKKFYYFILDIYYVLPYENARKIKVQKNSRWHIEKLRDNVNRKKVKYQKKKRKEIGHWEAIISTS